MKDGASFSSGVAATKAPEARPEPRASDRNVEEWAAVLAATALPVPPAAVPPPSPMEANGWRGGDGPLTPAAATAADPASGSEATKPGSRVDLRVDAADLGEIGIAVDRREDGVRVTIAVADERAARAVEPEKLRLLSVLTSSGVRVDSVTVVRAGSAGTGLAPGTPESSRSTPETEGPEDGGPKRSRKKNHFVG